MVRGRCRKGILQGHGRAGQRGQQAGFGAAATYAKALGMKDHYEKLSKIVSEIYAGDEYASKRSKKVEKLAAHAQKAA